MQTVKAFGVLLFFIMIFKMNASAQTFENTEKQEAIISVGWCITNLYFLSPFKIKIYETKNLSFHYNFTLHFYCR